MTQTQTAEIIVPDELSADIGQEIGAGAMVPRFVPRTNKAMVYLAQMAAQVRLYGYQDWRLAYNVMMEGAHLGMSPYAALREIHLIEGTPVASAQLQAALIRQRGNIPDEAWEVDTDEKTYCKVTFKPRHWKAAKTVGVTIDQVPDAWKQRSHSQWPKDPGDMLYALTVRRIRKRYFPEVMVGVGSLGAPAPSVAEALAASQIDVHALEETVQQDEWRCQYRTDPDDPEVVCGQPAHIVASRNGGAYLACDAGHNTPPPQEVRDTIRGGFTPHEEDADEGVDADRAGGPAAVAGRDDGLGGAGDEHVADGAPSGPQAREVGVADAEWKEADDPAVPDGDGGDQQGAPDDRGTPPGAGGDAGGPEDARGDAGGALPQSGLDRSEPDHQAVGEGPADHAGATDVAPQYTEATFREAAGIEDAPLPEPDEPYVPPTPQPTPAERARAMAAQLAKNDADLPPHIRKLKRHIEKSRDQSTVRRLTALGWDINKRQRVAEWLLTLSDERLKEVAEAFGTTL